MDHIGPFARTLTCAFGCAAGALACATAAAQAGYTWPVNAVAPNAPTVTALTYLARQATADRHAPIVVQTASPIASTEFCTQLRKLAAGIYVAPLSVYRTCFPDTAPLAALDLPFLARDWPDVRGLLNGYLGAAVAAGLQGNQGLRAADCATPVQAPSRSAGYPLARPTKCFGRQRASLGPSDARARRAPPRHRP